MVQSNKFKNNTIQNFKLDLKEYNSTNNENSCNCNRLSIEGHANLLIEKSQFDKDAAEILKRIRDLLKIAPISFQVPYSYIIDEINGERIFDNDGSLMLIRDYENDNIKEYYPQKNNIFVSKIIEIDKNTGDIISKIEPNYKKDGTITTNIIIFDEKLNSKYTMFQVDENGFVKCITEFFEKGKNFRSLFKNTNTQLPERYVETRKNNNNDFEMVDCKLSTYIEEIKYLTDKEQIIVEYKDNYRIINVKRLSLE